MDCKMTIIVISNCFLCIGIALVGIGHYVRRGSNLSKITTALGIGFWVCSSLLILVTLFWG